MATKIRVLEKIKQLQAQNIALLITTHNPQQAMYLAENILLLDQEYGFQQGSQERLLTLENLAKIYRTSVAQLAQHLNFLRAVLLTALYPNLSFQFILTTCKK